MKNKVRTLKIIVLLLLAGGFVHLPKLYSQIQTSKPMRLAVGIDFLETSLTIGGMIFDNGKFLDGFLPVYCQLFHPKFNRFILEAELGYLNYRNLGVPNESYSNIRRGYLMLGPSYFPVRFGENEGILLTVSTGLSREVVQFNFLPDPTQSFTTSGWSGLYFYGTGVQKWLWKKVLLQGKLGVSGDFNGGGNLLGGYLEGKINIAFRLK